MTRFEDGVRRIDMVLNKMGIKYAFISGTALGLCREGACIPTDTDIDFCFHVDDLPRLHEFEKELGFKRISHCGHEVFGYEFGDNDWVELDILHTHHDKIWHAWLQGSMWVANVYPKRMWDNLEYIYAYGVKCPVFHPIEEYLELTYGINWKIPDPYFSVRELERVTKTRRYNFDFKEI